VQYLGYAVKRSNGIDGLQMKIQIDMKAADFEQLWLNSMEWNGQDWDKQVDRFEPAPLLTWKYAYWFDSYAALKMAQGFISAVGSNHAIHTDEATGDWVMLTNYASPCHLRKVSVSA
jgi:hypothetical protein